MAVVPISQGASVRLNPLARENIRPVDLSSIGRAIGEGAERLGQAGAQFADNEQRLFEIRAEEEARRLDTEHMQGLRAFRERVRGARGIAAREAATQAETDLRQYNGEFLSRASNPLARRMLERSITTRTVQEVDSWAAHAAGQEAAAIDQGHEDRANGLIEEALDHAEEPEIAQARLGAAEQEVRSRGAFNGWTPETTDAQVLATRSRFYAGQARQRFEADDAEGARAVLDEHRGDLTAADEAGIRRLIDGELRANEADRDAAFILQGGAAAPAQDGEHPATPPGEADWYSPLRVDSSTVPGGRFGAPRRYGGHVGHDYSGVREGTPVYPMAEGRVVDVSHSATGGNTVEIEYAGGYRSRYLHLQDGSIRVRENQRVGPNDVVAGVGQTGTAAHGVHLHAEMIGPGNRHLDPTRVAGTRAPNLPAPDGTRIDVASAYAAIDRQPWPESRKRRAREAVQRQAGQNDMVRSRDEADAAREITQALVDMNRIGQRLTNLSQLPSAALQRANPSVVLQLQEQVQANNRPTAPEANSPLMGQLITMAAEDPNRFMREVNPELYRGRVTDAEVEQLTRTRLSISQRTGAQPSQIASLINMVQPPPNMARLNDRQRQEFVRERGRLISSVQERLRRTRGQEEITQDDILRAIRAEVTLVHPQSGPNQGDSVPLYRLHGTGNQFSIDYPSEAIPMLDRVLRSRGIQPTEQNRATLYIEYREEVDRAIGR